MASDFGGARPAVGTVVVGGGGALVGGEVQPARTSERGVSVTGVSSRIDSPFGTLDERLRRTRMAANARAAAERMPHGRFVDVLLDDGSTWIPGLFVAWERRADEWWGRVVTCDKGVANEHLMAARRLRPVEPTPS